MAWEPDEEAYAAALRVAKPGDAPGHVPPQNLSRSYGSAVQIASDPEAVRTLLGPGGLWFNSMTGSIMLGDAPLPDSAANVFRAGVEARYRTGEDGRTPVKFTKSDCWDALEHAARGCVMNPLRDELDGMVWDGVQRLDTVLPESLGIEAGSLQALLLRKWMISAVARAYAPGCKVDTVLVLVGPQGALKSSWFRAITGDRWFLDTQVRLDDKDAKLTMRKAWVLEWAELDSMRGKAQEATKAFISAQVDVFRPPYGRGLIEAPRHCVIVGTTNNVEFLSDETGNRRFWPIAVENINLELVRSNRDQLWAEAIAAYRAGGPGGQWWLEKEFEQHLTESQEKFTRNSDDVWGGPIAAYLELNKKEYYTTDEILENAIGKSKEKCDNRDEQRVGLFLRSQLFLRRRSRVNGVLRWIYSRK